MGSGMGCHKGMHVVKRAMRVVGLLGVVPLLYVCKGCKGVHVPTVRYTHIYVYRYICIYTHVYTYIYIYIYM